MRTKKSKLEKALDQGIKKTKKVQKKVEAEVDKWIKDHPETTKQAKKMAHDFAERSRKAYDIMKEEMGEAWDRVTERIGFVSYEEFAELEKRVKKLEAMVKKGK